MQRKDTILLKQQLADSLGESGLEYWKKLGDFLQLKTSKKELDELALTIFTLPQQAKIHNKLITSILYNTLPNLPKPVGAANCEFSGKISKKQSNEKAIGQHLKRRFNTRAIMMMSAEERSRISSLEHFKPKDIEEINLNKYPKGLLL